MLIKIVQIQSRLGDMLTLEERLLVFKQRPDFICLPEYSLVASDMPDFVRSAMMIKENLAYLAGLSEALSTCLIGGSVVEGDEEGLYNSAYLFDRGCIIGRYRKLNPVSGEIDKGILPGDKIFVREIEGIRLGILICADALNVALFEKMREYRPDIIFIPTISSYLPEERKLEKFKRDNDIYVRAARESLAYIVKTCGVGLLFGKRLQGRSLVAAPWGILKRVEPHAELSTAIMTTILDIDELRDFKAKGIAAGAVEE
nr:carbon-nitrogen hydrolase family protein [candidate division Zixibacteria bacterium]